MTMLRVLSISHSYPTKERPWVTPFIHSWAEAMKHHVELYMLVPSTKDTYLGEVITFSLPSSNRIPNKGIGKNHRRVSFIQQSIFLGSSVTTGMNIVKKQDIQLIHAHWALPSGLVAYFISKLTGVPYVVTTHGRDVLNNREYGYSVPSSPILGAATKRVLSSAKRVIVTSDITESAARKIVPELEVSKIPVGIDEHWFDDDDTRIYSKEGICCVGDLVPLKGQRLLLDAISMSDKLKNARVSIIGTGEDEQALKKLCDERSLSNVQFLGAIDNISLKQILLKTKILAFTSHIEAFGIVVLEALATGCRVVGSDTGIVRSLTEVDLFKDYLAVFYPGDVTSLRQALEIAISKEDLVSSDQFQIRRYIQNEFSWGRVCEEYNKI